MNYDNSRFTQALVDRGFTVVPHAQSNYAATLLSLASVLNMQHYSSNPSPLGDLDHLRLSIADSKLRAICCNLVIPICSYCQVTCFPVQLPISTVTLRGMVLSTLDSSRKRLFHREILNETSEGVRENELGHFLQAVVHIILFGYHAVKDR